MSKLYLFPSPLGDRCVMIHDSGVTLTAVKGNHPSNNREGWVFDLPSNLPVGHGALVQVSKEGYFFEENKGRLYPGGNTVVIEDWDAILAWDDFRLIKIPDAPPIPPPDPTHAGCVNGLLLRPWDWWWARINRQPGMPANDYKEVMLKSGLAQGPGPDEIIPDPDPLGTYGIRQQLGEFGKVPRGRLFFPASTPSIHITPDGEIQRFYTQENQCIADDPANPGGLIWAQIRMTNTTYRPFKC